MKIAFTTDIEGDWEHFQRYIRGSEVLYYQESTLRVRNDCLFVFGGDAFDRGMGDLRVGTALVDLKRSQPESVVLLMGNRDINKMRFTSELNTMIKPEQAFSAWWDPKAPQLHEWLRTSGLEDSVLHRLQWALTCTLGCPNTFEFRRQELMLLLRTQHVDDATVLKSFQDSATDGIYSQYLESAQVAHVQGNTLFVHGAADKRGLQFIPSMETRFCPNKSVEGRHVEDLHGWVEEINAFAQQCILDWKRRPHWETGGDGVTRRGGDALMAYQNKPAILNKTVAVHSYVDGLNIAAPGSLREGFEQRSDPYDKEVQTYLAQYGVRRVVVGHTPSGEAPASFVDPSSGFQLISADTNYATTSTGDRRGGSWCEVVIEPSGRARLHGALADGRGTYNCSVDEDPYIGTRRPDGSWVKVRLTSGAYLVSKGSGRHVESTLDWIEPIYLDYNGTTPLTARVKAALHHGVDALWGNAGTEGKYGSEARAAIAQGVARVAELIGCSSEQIIITSGGTESNNMAIRGAVMRAYQVNNKKEMPVHCVTTTFEHPAVARVLDALEAEGVALVSRLAVTAQGRLQEEVFRAALRPGQTRFISIMMANNEVGTLQDIGALVRIAKETLSGSAVFHTDAAQSVGKIPVNVQELGVDLLTLVGHKFYAPKAIGALYVRDPGVLALPFLHGGGQQGGQRAGTESALLVHALGVASLEARELMDERIAHMKRCLHVLWSCVQAAFPRARRWNDDGAALPNTLSVMLDPDGPPAYEVVHVLAPVLLCAAGAACHHGSTQPSATLCALGIPAEHALRTFRLSVGAGSRESEMEVAVTHLAQCMENLKKKKK